MSPTYTASSVPYCGILRSQGALATTKSRDTRVKSHHGIPATRRGENTRTGRLHICDTTGGNSSGSNRLRPLRKSQIRTKYLSTSTLQSFLVSLTRNLREFRHIHLVDRVQRMLNFSWHEMSNILTRDRFNMEHPFSVRSALLPISTLLAVPQQRPWSATALCHLNRHRAILPF